jgi:hypothetical protein
MTQQTLFRCVLNMSVVALLMLGGCSSRKVIQYRVVSYDEVVAGGTKVLCLPLRSVSSTYSNSAHVADGQMHSDSFMVEAFNALLPFEASKMLTTVACTSRVDQALNDSIPAYSLLAAHSADSARAASFFRELAAHWGVDYVLYPYACSVDYAITSSKGWRDDKYGQSYARPIAYRAGTSVHTQFWNREGKLVMERIGSAGADRSLMHSFFKRKRDKEENMVLAASRFYATPILKSLYKSIEAALWLKDTGVLTVDRSTEEQQAPPIPQQNH